MLTYYLIEKPSAKFLKNRLNINDNAYLVSLYCAFLRILFCY